jgi:hypothetical protein
MLACTDTFAGRLSHTASTAPAQIGKHIGPLHYRMTSCIGSLETTHCTSIRLPVGYFTLGPDFCTNTPFAIQPGEVCGNAWAAVERLVARCFAHGIGLLLDMHAARGGANSDTNQCAKVELWGNKLNLDLLVRCLCFMAQEVASGMEGSHWDPDGQRGPMEPSRCVYLL